MLVTEVIRQAEKEEAYTAIVTATRGERGDQMPVVARQRDSEHSAVVDLGSH